jgi:hypothetical protein
MRVFAGIVNLAALTLIVVAVWCGWTNVLLGLIAFCVLDGSVGLSLLRQQMKPMTDVFADDTPVEDQAAIDRAIERVRAEMAASALRHVTFTWPNGMKEH